MMPPPVYHDLEAQPPSPSPPQQQPQQQQQQQQQQPPLHTSPPHSHPPCYALLRLDDATLRRLNAPLSLPTPAPAPPAATAAAMPLGQALREALAAGQKVAMPIAIFALVGCCHLIGWGLLVYGTFAVAAASPASPTALLPGLLGEGDARGLGFLLYMSSVLACAFWLHGFIRQKRAALRQRQHQHQHEAAAGVRSPGPMGA